MRSYDAWRKKKILCYSCHISAGVSAALRCRVDASYARHEGGAATRRHATTIKGGDALKTTTTRDHGDDDVITSVATTTTTTLTKQR